MLTTTMKKIMLIVGARPNFMKVAPVLREIELKRRNRCILVHTGQHYDYHMSDMFFKNLGIRRPDYNLDVRSGSHSWQTAQVMMKLEPLVENEETAIVIVFGDVNSTVAAALVAKKKHKVLVHVEAGLRSGNKEMPEEINRIMTDSISDYLFTTEKSANENLLKEGHAAESIYFVGNVMVDNLYFQMGRCKQSEMKSSVVELKNKLRRKEYCCLTLHRPDNVDSSSRLKQLLEAIEELSSIVPVIFPCHPRTRKRIEEFGLQKCFKSKLNRDNRGIVILEPLDYNEFLYLWKDAALVMTDSGGLQEETSALDIPCMTLREETERPITVDRGSNMVVGYNSDYIVTNGKKALNGQWKKSEIPELWDGKASKRISSILEEI